LIGGGGEALAQPTEGRVSMAMTGTSSSLLSCGSGTLAGLAAIVLASSSVAERTMTSTSRLAARTVIEIADVSGTGGPRKEATRVLKAACAASSNSTRSRLRTSVKLTNH